MDLSDKIQPDASELSLFMRKTYLIIAAVAILGFLAICSRSHRTSSLPIGSDSSSQSASVNSASSSSNNSSPGVTPTNTLAYHNGTYTGTSADTPYGAVQIAVVVNGGKIADINFLQMPSDLGHSQEITYASEPLLKQTTLQAQSSHIDFVSGATSTSYGYEESLQAALNQAKVS